MCPEDGEGVNFYYGKMKHFLQNFIRYLFMTNNIVETRNSRLFGLDHLRALAIIMVVFYHYRMFAHPHWIDKTMGFGWAGVDLFFVLSGYLISTPLFARMSQGKPISVPEFFIKRVLRIIPLYLVVLSIYFLIPAFWERQALPPLWKFLAFTQNFGFDIKNYGTFSHVWSLCVEEHFYLFFPLTLLALLHYRIWRKGWVLLLALFIFGFVIRFISWYALVAPHSGQDNFGVIWYKYIYYPTYNRLDGLLAGVAIAALFTFKPRIKAQIVKYGNQILVLGILVLTGAWFLCEDQHRFYATIFGFPVVSIGYGVLVIAALSPTCVLFRYKSRTTTLIAKLSYALYLSHKGVIHLVHPQFEKLGIDPKGNLMVLLCFATALLGAYILNKVVERPFLQWRQVILERRRKRQVQKI